MWSAQGSPTSRQTQRPERHCISPQHSALDAHGSSCRKQHALSPPNDSAAQKIAPQHSLFEPQPSVCIPQPSTFVQKPSKQRIEPPSAAPQQS